MYFNKLTMKTTTTLLLFLIAFSVQSQNYKFGKVSKEELQENINPLDSSANATVLYRNESIWFDFSGESGFVQKRSVHERIKIYNKEGYKWATKKVRLYNKSNSSSEDLLSLKGYTYNLVDGKVEDDKLKKDGIFKEEVNKYWKTNSFTMPNIKDGCVIEYSYIISSPFLGIDDIDFQFTIPIKKFDLSVKTPEYFSYNKLLNPKAIYHPKLTDSKRARQESWTTRRDITRSRDAGSYQSEIKFDENIINCNEENIPALKPEPYVSNIGNYKSKLSLELSAIKYPNEPYKTFSSSWESVTRTIYNNEDFGGQLSKTSYFKDDIDALVSGVGDIQQKTGLIFDFIRSKVKWNSFYGYTSDIGVRRAYKDGSGNVADINLMLIAMLRYAGINANPVLVSTRDNGIPLFPTRNGFNYVICLIESEGFNVLLDATAPFSTFNVLPTRTLNWQGRVIREHGSSTWINLTPMSPSMEATSLNAKINPDFSIEGKVRQQKLNYRAMSYRNAYAGLSDDGLIKNIEEDNAGLTVSEVNMENAKNSHLPLQLNYDYTLDNSIEEIGENLYFSPMLFLASEENPFKAESRKFPIDLSYPFSDKFMINIMLPEGYAIESLPQNEKLEFDGIGDFTYLAQQNGAYLQLTIALNVTTAIILPQDYQNFKQFFSRIIEKQSEKIVLKKAM